MAIFDAAMFKAWPLAKGSGVTSSGVVKCFNYKFGDFQCNAAMSLYKALKVETCLHGLNGLYDVMRCLHVAGTGTFTLTFVCPHRILDLHRYY